MHKSYKWSIHTKILEFVSDSFCGISACPIWRTHGCNGSVFLDAVGLGATALGVGTVSGYISPWTGRFYSLMDPTYAKDHIPIIASVSEHQLKAWSSVDQSWILMPDRPCTVKGCHRPSQFTNARDRCRCSSKDPEFIKMNRYDQENMKDDEPLLKFVVNNPALLAGNCSQLCSTCKMDVERK